MTILSWWHLLGSNRLSKAQLQYSFFVDISELVQRDSKTGIQRVVRSIVNGLLAHGVDGYQVEFVHAAKGEPYRYAHKYIQRLRGFPHAAIVDAEIDPQAGDIFLGLDFQDTVVPSQAAFLHEIREKGAKVYFVVYDLLPIHFRNYFAPVIFENHTAWLNTVTQSDGAICISESVSIELVEWLQSNQPIRQKPFGVGWFHLGADIEASQPTLGLASDASDTLRSLARRPTFLLVGTVEPRKGQAQALAAFQVLWRTGIDINLVLVGRQGNMVNALVADLNACPELGQRLFWLDGISDEFLEKVYAASSCLIAASEGEGFGLPLIEAAQHKLPIIARDIPVFREVAGTHAFYFSGLDTSTLSDAVVEWLALFKSGRHPKSDAMPVLTWAKSTTQLLDVVINNKWSARWQSDGTFCCAATDPRIKTQLGKRQGDSIETTGADGFLFYGPYISLPAGEYQIRIHGEVRNLAKRTFEVETTAELGDKLLSVHTFDAVRTDGLVAEIDVRIPIAVSGFEVRVSVAAETEMRVDKLEISLRSPFAPHASDKYSPAFTKPSKRSNTLQTRKSKSALTETLQELLLEDGEEFVAATYMALLKRRPDATGGRNYLRALRNGTSKLQILYEISTSADARDLGIEIPGLLAAFAREGIGEKSEKPAPAPPAQATAVTRAEQLLVVGDTDKFIEIAYWVLLKRAPDAEGIANCRNRLRDGASKTQILHELFSSPECREIGVELPGLRDTFAREGLNVVDAKVSLSPEHLPQAAKSLTELLGYQGGRFVECAYLTLFKRPSDRREFQDRLEQLLAGTSKIQILSEMAASKEGIASGVQLPGLSAAIIRYNLSRTPILGRFVKLFVDVEGDSAAERRGRVAEQRLLTLEAEVGGRFEEIERTGSGLAAMEQKAFAARQETDARIVSLERSVAGLRQLIEQYDRTAPAAEPSSSDAASTKSSGRLALDLRAEEIARDLRQAR